MWRNQNAKVRFVVPKWAICFLKFHFHRFLIIFMAKLSKGSCESVRSKTKKATAYHPRFFLVTVPFNWLSCWLCPLRIKQINWNLSAPVLRTFLRTGQMETKSLQNMKRTLCWTSFIWNRYCEGAKTATAGTTPLLKRLRFFKNFAWNFKCRWIFLELDSWRPNQSLEREREVRRRVYVIHDYKTSTFHEGISRRNRAVMAKNEQKSVLHVQSY